MQIHRIEKIWEINHLEPLNLATKNMWLLYLTLIGITMTKNSYLNLSLPNI